MVFAILLSGFNEVLVPMIADHEQAGQHSALEHLSCVATKWGLYLSVPFFLVIFTLPVEIITAVPGQASPQASFRW